MGGLLLDILSNELPQPTSQAVKKLLLPCLHNGRCQWYRVVIRQVLCAELEVSVVMVDLNL